MIIQLSPTKGVSIDISPRIAPLDMWTYVRNVHFDEGGIRKSNRWVDLLVNTVEPYGLWSINDPSKTFVVVAGLKKIYAFIGQSGFNITRQSSGVDVDYTGSTSDHWTATVFNGIPIFNNSVDLPQAWNPMDTSIRLVDLPNWPTDKRAKVIRTFKNYLVALNVSGDPRMVKWSHSAPPGSLPSSWDPTDATKEAGEKSLGEGDDKLVDCLQLGDSNVIYGQSSITLMRLAPLPFVFSFLGVSKASGVISVDCAKEFNGIHFVVTSDDVILFDGNSIRSIAEGRIRRWLFSNIEPQAIGLVRVVKNQRSREMWVFFPSLGSSVLNMAAVWNWQYDTWTIMDDVQSFRSVSQQMFVESGATGVWDTDTGTWNSDSQPWSGETPIESVVSGRFLGGSISPTPKVMHYDRSLPSTSKSVLERVAIDAFANRDGSIVRDPTRRKLSLGVWPYIETSNNQQFKIRLGSHNRPEEAVNWGVDKVFSVGSVDKVDDYREGRYLAVHIEDVPGSDWRLVSFGLEVSPLGLL